MIPILGAYLVQVGDLTRKVYLASLPLIVATGLWVWIDELATISDDEKADRKTMVIEFGLKFSARFGILALAALFFATLIVAVLSSSTAPLTLVALLLIGLAWKIVSISWNEYSHPERMIALGRNAFMLHLATGIIIAASSLVA